MEVVLKCFSSFFSFSFSKPNKREPTVVNGVTITAGQRKYLGPPPDWQGGVPKESNVFIGGIPHDYREDKLVPLFEKFGQLYEFRLMMEPHSNSNRGYGFVTFVKQEDAKKCVADLNGHSFRPGQKLDMVLQKEPNRLFVRPIPREMTKDVILSTLRAVLEEVEDVIIFNDANDITRHRGFAFVDFASHLAAKAAKKKIKHGDLAVQGKSCTADWADPISEPDEQVMAHVKTAFVKNLAPTATEELIESIFNKFGAVDKVKKTRDFCFVHFADRAAALAAIEAINGTEIEGVKAEVQLAKPTEGQLENTVDSSGLLKRKKARDDKSLRHLRNEPRAAPGDRDRDQRHFRNLPFDYRGPPRDSYSPVFREGGGGSRHDSFDRGRPLLPPPPRDSYRDHGYEGDFRGAGDYNQERDWNRPRGYGRDRSPPRNVPFGLRLGGSNAPLLPPAPSMRDTYFNEPPPSLSLPLPPPPPPPYQGGGGFRNQGSRGRPDQGNRGGQNFDQGRFPSQQENFRRVLPLPPQRNGGDNNFEGEARGFGQFHREERFVERRPPVEDEPFSKRPRIHQEPPSFREPEFQPARERERERERERDVPPSHPQRSFQEPFQPQGDFRRQGFFSFFFSFDTWG